MKKLQDFDKNVPIIDRFVQIEALKLAERHDGYHNYLHQEYQRKKKRLINVPDKDVKTKPYWSVDNKFNPYYVLKHHKQISRSIRKKLHNGTYSPLPVYEEKIPKGNGKYRVVNIYQIPDAAVSNYLYYRLLSKNKHRFSYYAYAYRDDKNLHYAIQDISIELKSHARLFVAEYDFSDFFGSISHDYLFKQMDENGFVITHAERKLISRFLPNDGVGIPQGTSISLFLANLVCWNLDRQLEAEGLKFARYADDTIIWSDDYSHDHPLSVWLEESAPIRGLKHQILPSLHSGRSSVYLIYIHCNSKLKINPISFFTLTGIAGGIHYAKATQ